MTLLNALSFARDFAAVSVGIAVALVAVIVMSGAGGLGASAVASLAIVAASSIVTFSAYGALQLFGATPTAAAPWAALALSLALMVMGAQQFGVRGLWVATLIALGMGLAALFVWAFGGRGPGLIGAAAPAASFALLMLLLSGALASTVRAVDLAGQRLGQTPTARALFATPPDWFDCAYATFGGVAAQPALCPFNPPKVEQQPGWAEPAPPPPMRDRAPIRPENPTVDTAEADAPAAVPTRAPEPDAPAVDTPDFDAIIGQEDVAPAEPAALAEADVALGSGVALRGADAPDAPAAAPSATKPPSDMAETSVEASPEALPATADAQTIRRIAEPTPPIETASIPAAPSTRPERSRTEFVCFPMLGVLAEQLCPDRRLSERDVEVAWRSPGGEAVAAVDGVECFVDPRQGLQATFIVDLSEEMLGAIDRGSDSASGRMRKTDAIYEMVTRLIGSARSDVEGGAGELLLSLYLATGSQLSSPWATVAHGPDKIDRLFDVRSSGQTLALMRRLRAEIQQLRPGAARTELIESVNAAMATLPARDSGVIQPLVMVLTDRTVAAQLSEEDAARAGAAIAASGAPLFIVELGAIAASEQMRILVEASGGAAFGARNAADLSAVVDRAMGRARSFCAVGVTAPATFFDENTLEVKLRRRMIDGCMLQQIAHLDCNGVRMERRIEPRP